MGTDCLRITLRRARSILPDPSIGVAEIHVEDLIKKSKDGEQ